MTQSAKGRAARLASVAGLRALAASLAVGVLAGLLTAYARLHLGLPGHKALFWLTPVLLARLAWGHPAGATAGACAAAAAALAFGGNIAGGVLLVPLVALAGGVLDVAAALAERRRIGPVGWLGLFAAAGMAANLLCAAKRLLGDWHAVRPVLGLTGPLASVASYAAFGLLAGLIAAAASLAIRRARP